MRAPISYVAAPTALDADGVCQAQTTAGAGDLLINGALATAGVAIFGEQQRVTLYSAANLSTLTFTIYGTTRIGDSISEAIAGPGATTVTTTSNFYTVTRVAVSGAVGTNVTVGVSNALETPWVPLDPSHPLKGISVQLSTSANLTYEVQYAPYPLEGAAESTMFALADSTLTAKTASASLVTTLPFYLIRLKITSFVAGTATLRVAEGVA